MRCSILFVAGLLVVLGVAAKSEGQEKKALTIPHQNNETPLVELKAHAERYIGRTFIICGGIMIDDAYTGAYSATQDTYHSLRFVELGKDTTAIGLQDVVHVYLPKRTGNSVVDVVSKAKGLRLARVKATIQPDKYAKDKNWQCMEALDVQFNKPDMSGWQPWVMGGGNVGNVVSAPPAVATAKEPLYEMSKDGYVYATSSIDPSLEKLPRHFGGHDPQRIYDISAKRFRPKGEFETTQQYQERLRLTRKGPCLVI